MKITKFLASGVFAAVFLTIRIGLSWGGDSDAGFEVTCNQTSHTVVSPFEPNFKYVIAVKNTGDATDVFSFIPDEISSSGWLVLGPSGFLELEPGEVGYNIVIVEPQEIPNGSKLTLNIRISSENDPEVKQTITLTTTSISLGMCDEIPRRSLICGKVYDSQTHKPIPNAEIKLYLWNPNWCDIVTTDADGNYELRCISYEYLKRVCDEYNLRASPVQYLEVSAAGYQMYYEKDVKPPEGKTLQKDIYLDRKRVRASYHLSWEKDLNFGPWKCPTSDDWEYIAAGSGEHDPPSGPVTYIFCLFDSSGKLIYSHETATQVWGIDISHDGRYVAAGSMEPEGKLYLYDRINDSLHEWYVGGDVREVKFSHDGRYLAAGPVPGGRAGHVGLWDVEAHELLWQYETSDWVREITFAPDDSYVAVANSGGYLYVFDTSSGKLLWKRFHGGYCPFVLEISQDGSRIAVAGKSHEVYMYDRDGNLLWTYPTDQVVTDGKMSADGSKIVVGTVWGGIYCIDGDGNLMWRKKRNVGHNAVYITKNGKYIALGGAGIMLLDSQGDVLWQDNFGWVDYVKVSEDGSKIIAGYSDPDVVRLYEGNITKITVNPPVAHFTYSPLLPKIGEEVKFDASSSYDPDGTIADYEWDFGDGSTASGVKASHSYREVGTYTVTLTVADNDGVVGKISKTVEVPFVAVWWDEWHDAAGNAFSYRIPVDIFSEVEVWGYQMCITLSPECFNYSHAQVQGNDIRPVMKDGDRFCELPYWIESWNPDGESKVWVKIPCIRDVRIYLYYGNAEVESGSDGRGTFEFFEDFEAYPVGGAIDGLGGWKVAKGVWTVEKGPTGGKSLFADTRGEWWSDWSYGVYRRFSLHDSVAVELDFYIDGDYDMYSGDPLMWFIFRNSDSNWVGVGWGGWNRYHVITVNGVAGGEGSIRDIPTCQWLHLSFKALGDEVTEEKVGGGSISSCTASRSGDKIGFSVRGWRAYWDNIRIRRYIEPEPTYTLGEEENPQRLVGDFDGNGSVDFDDFFLFVDHFGTSTGQAGFEPIYDLDDDGRVGFDDFFIFVDHFGESRQAKMAVAGVKPRIFLNINEGDLGPVVEVRTEGAKGFGLVLRYDPKVYEFLRAQVSSELPILTKEEPGRLAFACVGDGARLVFRSRGEFGGAMEVEEAVVVDRAYRVSDAGVRGTLIVALGRNFPNPFNSSTVVVYTIPEATHVKLEVYDLLGRVVKVLVNGVQDAGRHRLVWDGRDSSGRPVASGAYLIRLEAGPFCRMRKAVLIR